jgi:hypothetical protein
MVRDFHPIVVELDHGELDRRRKGRRGANHRGPAGRQRGASRILTRGLEGNFFMLDRGTLVIQMAKAFAGEGVMDPAQPNEETRRRADEALSRVEFYLGVGVEQAKDIVSKVLEDVT